MVATSNSNVHTFLVSSEIQLHTPVSKCRKTLMTYRQRAQSWSLPFSMKKPKLVVTWTANNEQRTIHHLFFFAALWHAVLYIGRVVGKVQTSATGAVLWGGKLERGMNLLLWWGESGPSLIQVQPIPSLGPRLKTNPSTDRFQYRVLYWKWYTRWMRSGDETTYTRSSHEIVCIVYECTAE